MKRVLFFIIIMMICGSLNAQNKIKWPEPIKDTSWIEIRCDTIKGKIEVFIGNGSMKGEGMIVSCETIEWRDHIYSAKDRHYIDSVENRIHSWSSGGIGFSNGYPVKSVYIKTEGMWRRLESEKYTLIPY